jgi:pantoate--beta-alanine ligase
MGALHAGHGSLIRAARTACSRVAVSLFVNPTQFGPTEDYARYPRSFDADCALAEREGAYVLFAPTVDELYPNGPASTFVEVPDLSGRLDGASRPGHFRGVATVVAKLLIAAEPDCAFFGQKDAAQVSALRQRLSFARSFAIPMALPSALAMSTSVLCSALRLLRLVVPFAMLRHLSPRASAALAF